MVDEERFGADARAAVVGTAWGTVDIAFAPGAVMQVAAQWRRECGASPPVVSTIMGTTDARVRTSASLYCPSFCLTQPLPVAWTNGPWLLRPISLQFHSNMPLTLAVFW